MKIQDLRQVLSSATRVQIKAWSNDHNQVTIIFEGCAKRAFHYDHAVIDYMFLSNINPCTLVIIVQPRGVSTGNRV